MFIVGVCFELDCLFGLLWLNGYLFDVIEALSCASILLGEYS